MEHTYCDLLIKGENCSSFCYLSHKTGNIWFGMTLEKDGWYEMLISEDRIDNYYTFNDSDVLEVLKANPIPEAFYKNLSIKKKLINYSKFYDGAVHLV